MLRIHCKIALCFLISLFYLSAILKIRDGEYAHYLGLVVAYTWNREKQMFVALGKEFDMLGPQLVEASERANVLLMTVCMIVKETARET